MRPARITYHALNVAICAALIGSLLATQHGNHIDWVAVALISVLLFSGLMSMSALRRDKP